MLFLVVFIAIYTNFMHGMQAFHYLVQGYQFDAAGIWCQRQISAAAPQGTLS